MRIAIGGLYQESHSFSPAAATMNQFRAGYLLYGEQIIQNLAPLNHEMGGAIESAQGHDLIPLLYGATGASGQPIRRETFETLCADLCQQLKTALPVDGVFLAMHGAMLAEHIDDATGHVLQAIRNIVGPAIPIVATLDLHANVTCQMVAVTDALVGYHTAPHIDQRNTGKRGMTLLLNILNGQAKPTMYLQQIPMILPPENGRTTQGPFSEIMSQIVALETQPDILSASAYSVQPWLDLPEMGCGIIVITNNNPNLAQKEALCLAQQFWQSRDRFVDTLLTPETIIAQARSTNQYPYIISDSADSPSSGAPGDSTVFLKALLESNFQECVLLNILDPAAVKKAIQVGVGNRATFTIGATMSSQFYRPVTCQATVKTISDGKFKNKGPGFKGFEFQMGRTVVLVSGGIHIVVMEQPVIQWDPELYRSQGLDPAESKITAVKSPAAFRAAYEPFATKVLILDAPGTCSPNLRTFPWKRVKRPIYPLDTEIDWLPAPI